MECLWIIINHCLQCWLQTITVLHLLTCVHCTKVRALKVAYLFGLVIYKDVRKVGAMKYCSMKRMALTGSYTELCVDHVGRNMLFFFKWTAIFANFVAPELQLVFKHFEGFIESYGTKKWGWAWYSWQLGSTSNDLQGNCW